MNCMQEDMARAAKKLGVRIVIGYNANLPDGTSIDTQALSRLWWAFGHNRICLQSNR